ncbi:MAG: YesL family protein [Eubacteriales bacterium]|nr:YesL family protein [Eubacteriales bacterium]
MFGKFMNNYYYGKAGKGDYNKENLPKNRWQLFWEMLRVRFGALFQLNLISAIFFVPLFYIAAKGFESLLSLAQVILTVQQGGESITPDMVAVAENSGLHMYAILFRTCLWLVPCIIITGPAQAAMAYVTRNWARDEHAFVFSDFKDAFKSNWKQALVISGITSLLPLLMLMSWQFYGRMAQNSVFFVIPQIFALMVGFLWLLGLPFAYPMIVTYNMTIGQIIKNCLLLAIAKLPQNVGVRLAMLIPVAIAFLVSLFTPYALFSLMFLGGYYLLLGNALSRFVYASYTNGVFDKYINIKIPGAEVNRGMISEEELEGIYEDENSLGESKDKDYVSPSDESGSII